MQHFLITRYNITFGPAVKAGIDALSSEWLENRDRMFRTCCVPSVEAQQNRDFEWFVLFHPATPTRYYDFLDGIATVILAADLRSAKQKISRRRLFRGATLTTRIDSDDLIAIDFTAKLRTAAQAAASNRFGNRVDFVVVPRSGGITDVTSRRWLPSKNDSPGYVGLYESPRVWRKWQTPLDFNHMTIVDLFPVVSIDDGEVQWLTTIHASNLSRRRFKQSPDRDLNELLDRFPALRNLTSQASHLT